MMITINYKSVTTEGTATTGVHKYNTIEEAKIDIMSAIFTEGCTVIDPVVTDDTGRRYNISISILEV